MPAAKSKLVVDHFVWKSRVDEATLVSLTALFPMSQVSARQVRCHQQSNRQTPQVPHKNRSSLLGRWAW